MSKNFEWNNSKKVIHQKTISNVTPTPRSKATDRLPDVDDELE